MLHVSMPIQNHFMDTVQKKSQGYGKVHSKHLQGKSLFFPYAFLTKLLQNIALFERFAYWMKKIVFIFLKNYFIYLFSQNKILQSYLVIISIFFKNVTFAKQNAYIFMLDIYYSK